MEHISELRNEMTRVWYDLRARKIKPPEASELANVAGKILTSAKLELEYAMLPRDRQTIPFLHQTEDAAPAASGTAATPAP